MLFISDKISLSGTEIELRAIRSQGAGGQNVNKVATAIHLRFDIKASSLPEYLKARLLGLKDYRISNEGVIILKSQQHRTQEKNRSEAMNRLKILIQSVLVTPKKRRLSKPSHNARIKRMETKSHKGRIKTLRGRVDNHE